MGFDERLLQPPVARAAYSDRTAWLMAEMSRLAYHKFELGEEDDDQVAARLRELQNLDAIKDALARYRRNCALAHTEDRDFLEDRLRIFGFDLVRTFNIRDTQDFLAKRDDDRIAVLAFRGTEQDFDDIRTDLDARFYTRDGHRTHSGFWRAYWWAAPEIRQAVTELQDYKLYVTGHSLGGALALIATQDLNADHIAACYTFGSLRVGNSEFGDPIKPPIYRIVNAADMVPWLPPALLLDVIGLFRCLPVPFLQRLLRTFRGYAHHGDMRYLTACKPDFSDLRLIANPSLPRRIRRLVPRLIADWQASYKDHAVDAYCRKLKAYALQRLDADRPHRSAVPGAARGATHTKAL